MLTVVAARRAACLAWLSIIVVAGLGAGGLVDLLDVLVLQLANCPSPPWQIMYLTLEKTVLVPGFVDVGRRPWRRVPDSLHRA